MAIGVGAALWVYGTQVVIISTPAGTSAGNFSTAAQATNFIQADVTPIGDVTLDITFILAPDGNKAVHLFRRDRNIDGANDAVEPGANHQHVYVGSFPLTAAATRQYHRLTDIPLVADQDFYFQLDTATVATATNSTTIKLTPKTYNAKA